jgi:hypothetical protein
LLKDKLKDLCDILKFKYMDFRYLYLSEFYMDHVLFYWQHYVCGQRCENCRNWTYMGRLKSDGIEIGSCSLWKEDFLDYHGHCFSWNQDLDEDERGYTHDEDGCEMPSKTPNGKQITVISQNGRWVYLHDGMPYWYSKKQC